MRKGSEALLAHVPRLLLDWPRVSGGDRYRLQAGSMLLADVSGFTSLSERLAVRGRAGAEEITEVINACFSRLMTIAYQDGAGLIKFGGDSMLMLLEGADHELRASRAAMRMQAEMASMETVQTSVGDVHLAMSVGVNSGHFHLYVVGELHKELVVVGPDVDRVVALEKAAEAGQVLVGAATAAAIGPAITREHGEFRLLLAEPGLPAPNPVFPPPPSGADPAFFIPAPLRAHLETGDIEGEHRLVTVGFIPFRGVGALLASDGPEALGEALEELFSRVEVEADAADLYLHDNDVDRDGGRILLLAGAPNASEWDEEKMLRLVRRVVDKEHRLEVRAGINRGRVFTGEIGTEHRRTFAIMGDAVNVAARLAASAAAGHVVVTPAVLDHAESLYEGRKLRPLTLKGKAQPVAAISVGRRLGPRRQGTQERLPLTGRDAEMGVLRGALAAASAGRGHVVELVGEAGLGKSRLLEELRAGLTGMGMQAINCEPYESDTAYAAFRGLTRSLLDVEPDGDAAHMTEELSRRLRPFAPELLPWIPLLAMVLDVEVLPTLEVEQLAPEFRRTRLAEVVATVFARLLPETNFIAFEDTHWMDEASFELLRALARETPRHPWLVCVTRRPGEGASLSEVAGAVTVELRPLSADTVTGMAESAAQRLNLHPAAAARLSARAGGNPLFLSELLLSGGAPDDEVPETVEAVINTRIDRLPSRQRTLLRYASVLGPSFSLDLLARCVGDEGVADASSWTELDEFLARDAGGFRFRHALFRDVAYEGLSYQRRRELHLKVGLAHESEAEGRVDDIAELLSLHFSRADDHARAWRYGRVAAERARAKAAHLEAAQFYTRALTASRTLTDLSPAEVAATWEALGDVAEPAGHFDQAADAYRHARRLDSRPETQPRLLLKAGNVRERMSRYQHARHWYRRALRECEAVGDRRARVHQHMEICLAYAGVAYRIGDFKEMVNWAEQALGDAEAIRDRAGEAHSYYLLHLGYTSLGSPERTRYRNLAVPLLEALGDERRLGNALNNVGVDAYYEGDWTTSMEFHGRARAARERAGDVAGVAASMFNMAEVLSDQGRLSAATELLERARATAVATGYKALAGACTTNLGRVAARQGRFREAEAMLRASIADLTEIDARSLADSALAVLAETALMKGAPAAARRRVDELLGALGDAPFPVLEAMLMRVRGIANLDLGKLDAAQRDLDRCIAVATQNRVRYEEALALRGRCRLAQLRSEPEAGAICGRADQILRSLGVVEVYGHGPAVPQDDPARTPSAAAV